MENFKDCSRILLGSECDFYGYHSSSQHQPYGGDHSQPHFYTTAGMGMLWFRHPRHTVVTVPQYLNPQAVVLLLWEMKQNLKKTRDLFKKEISRIFTSARRSKRPKSSLRVWTKSWADRFMDNWVKPLISAKRMLQMTKNLKILYFKSTFLKDKGVPAWLL